MRTRHPKSLVAGLMWFNTDQANEQREVLGSIRHLAQEGDGELLSNSKMQKICSYIRYQYALKDPSDVLNATAAPTFWRTNLAAPGE